MSSRSLLIAALSLWHAAPASAALRASSPSPFPRYDLSVTLHPDVPRLEASGTIQLPPEGRPRETLELMLMPGMQDLKVEVLQPAVCAGLAEVAVKQEDASIRVLRLPRPLPAGAPVRLRFSYQGGEQTVYQFDLGRRSSVALGLNTAWYPWYQHRHGTGSLQVTVPKGYTAVAPGALHSSAEEAARGVFRYQSREPLYFSFAAGVYASSTRPGPIPISAYLLHPRPAVPRYLEGCARALRVLTREFGPYPYGGFSLVEVPPDQANERAGLFAGSSVAGIIFVRSDMMDRPFNLAYFAHELGHQWWGNLVIPEGSRGSMMLTEGMAQYGALQAVAAIEGPGAAEQFRRVGYPGFAFQSGEGALLYSAAGLDQPLASLSQGYVAHELADSKGFLVLDLLSRTVGRARFRTALHAVTRHAAIRGLTWAGFLTTIQAHAHQDLRWFYGQWFERAGAPDWTLAWSQRRGRLSLRLRQVAPYYRATVKLLIQGAGSRRQVRELSLDGAEFHADWPVPFPIRSVVLDPDFEVLHWTPELRQWAQALAPVWHADVQRQEGRTDSAIQEYRAVIARQPQPDLHGVGFLAEMGLGFALTDRKQWIEAKPHLEAALRSPVRRPELLPWVYLVLAMTARELGDRPTLDWAIAAARAADADPRARTGAAEAAEALRHDR